MPASDKKSSETSKKMPIIMDGDRIYKMEVDYSSTCDEKIPAAEKLAEQGKVSEAVDSLMILEKQTRTGGDAHSTSRILVALVGLCFKARQWDLLNETIQVVTKKRSQIKMAVTKMVQQCCEYVDQMPDRDTKLKLMDTLRTVTAGKIYVEVERARLTHKLALLKEAEGEVEEAATAMQELSVETYGRMDREEKIEMILEQMRLCLLRKDYVRTQIISKKVSTKFFDSGKHNDLKLKFYKLMIELDSHDHSFLKICQHYQAIYNTTPPKDEEKGEEEKEKTEKPKEEQPGKLEELAHVVKYLVLAPHDNHQHDFLHRVRADPLLCMIPAYQALLELFANQELIKWAGLVEQFQTELRGTDVFGKDEAGEARWGKLRDRVVEHNIRIMAKYYTRIRLSRMAELLDLGAKECEDFLCQLVVSGTVSARTDRLEGIITFGAEPSSSERLNDWVMNVNSLMSLVNKTTHLINRETCVHRVALKVGGDE